MAALVCSVRLKCYGASSRVRTRFRRVAVRLPSVWIYLVRHRWKLLHSHVGGKYFCLARGRVCASVCSRAFDARADSAAPPKHHIHLELLPEWRTRKEQRVLFCAGVYANLRLGSLFLLCVLGSILLFLRKQRKRNLRLVFRRFSGFSHCFSFKVFKGIDPYYVGLTNPATTCDRS